MLTYHLMNLDSQAATTARKTDAVVIAYLLLFLVDVIYLCDETAILISTDEEVAFTTLVISQRVYNKQGTFSFCPISKYFMILCKAGSTAPISCA